MAIAESTYFIFNNETSKKYGIINCSMETGLKEEQFYSERSLERKRVKGNEIPYLQEVVDEPLKLKVTFGFENPWDDENIRAVARWLRQPYFCEMSFSEDPNKIYFVMYTGSPTLLHNSLKQGVINLEFENISQYIYSPVYTTQQYDLSSNPSSGTDITYINEGDVEDTPDIEIIKVGNGDIQIVNYSDGGREFKVESILNGETVTIDNENQEIETSIPNTYRYENVTTDYISYPRGINKLKIYGGCKIQFRSRFKFLK
ncbi:phage tail domain-containing protein [Paenibacillus sp. FSL E2-0178]|uniref:phage tail domain-containing protein n=1 Tax=Paenibacillus sp. FSL E2-0178 TaxID=2921361 RepID=UPI003158E5C6